jgi:hypothetical protein
VGAIVVRGRQRGTVDGSNRPFQRVLNLLAALRRPFRE